MNVLVLGNTQGEVSQRDREYYQEYVDFFGRAAEASHLSASVAACLLEDLIIRVGDGIFSIYDTRNNRELSEYDAIFFRGAFRNYLDVVGVVSRYGHAHDIALINDYQWVHDSSKLFQATEFHLMNVPIAQTVLVTNSTLSHFDKIQDWQFPCIMKAVHGSHGSDNYVVNDLQEIIAITTKQPDIRFVLQRFVANDGDYRLLVVGDEVIAIGRKAGDGTHLNNTSQGGEARQVDVEALPDEMVAQARAICQRFGIKVGGVDVIQDKETGEHYFLEVNAQPQLMTGAYVDQKEQLVGKLLAHLDQR
jgi:glutathione synthase/RimK-type ligase-like ATP-grasp enzyme